MHFAFVCLPASGHVNPTLPVVAELVRRGHRVTYATSSKYAEAVESAGAAFFESGEDLAAQFPRVGKPAEDSRAALPAAGTLAGVPSGMMSGLLERLLERAREEFPALLARLADDRPDALCYDAMTLAGKMAAMKLALPDIALLPTYATNEHFSMRELMPARAPAEMRVAWQQARRLISDFAAEQGLSRFTFMDGPPPSLNICFIPRDFQPAGDTFDARFHFVGPSLGERADAEAWQPGSRNTPRGIVRAGGHPGQCGSPPLLSTAGCPAPCRRVSLAHGDEFHDGGSVLQSAFGRFSPAARTGKPVHAASRTWDWDAVFLRNRSRRL
jgi:MGT family glycosyltransferase